MLPLGRGDSRYGGGDTPIDLAYAVQVVAGLIRQVRTSAKYDGAMGSSQHPTESEQLTAELEHPDANSIWARAQETLGDVDIGEPVDQRRVLTALIRIDYGVFS